ncbi:MAG: DNA repair protein RecO, partial [Chloroflexi bacterium]|nr:DNA repair protein RecO [Chloroflexota bacterium]
EPFLALHEDLVRAAYANYVVELLDRFMAEQNTGRAEFNLLVHTLERLCTESDPRLVARYYEMELLGLAGFAPSLHQCAVGQEEIEPCDQFFSPADGGIICPQHHTGLDRSIPLSLNTLKVLRYMQSRAWDAVSVLQLSTPLHRELEQLMLVYITYLLEQRLQSVDFINRLRREEID